METRSKIRSRRGVKICNILILSINISFLRWYTKQIGFKSPIERIKPCVQIFRYSVSRASMVTRTSDAVVQLLITHSAASIGINYSMHVFFVLSHFVLVQKEEDRPKLLEYNRRSRHRISLRIRILLFEFYVSINGLVISVQSCFVQWCSNQWERCLVEQVELKITVPSRRK